MDAHAYAYISFRRLLTNHHALLHVRQVTITNEKGDRLNDPEFDSALSSPHFFETAPWDTAGQNSVTVSLVTNNQALCVAAYTYALTSTHSTAHASHIAHPRPLIPAV